MHIHLSKKTGTACIAFLLVVVTGTGAAAQNPVDSCKPSQIVKATAFIAGAKDTLTRLGSRQQSILPVYIANGFRLQLTDTTYRIVDFRLGFYNSRTGIYYEQKCMGDSVSASKLTIASHEVIMGVSRFFLDNIKVEKDNDCYWVRAIAYSTPNNPNSTPNKLHASPHTH